eukprot:scaffold462_cov195-Pinguiococcus_pyrenoidosus.AAC.94
MPSLTPHVAAVGLIFLCAIKRLLLAQHREDAEDAWHTCATKKRPKRPAIPRAEANARLGSPTRVQADTHQARGGRLADVLEMHGVALDQTADVDDHVHRVGQSEIPRRQRQLKSARHLRLEDVLLLHAALLERFHRSVLQLGDHIVIPARRDDADAHVRSVKFRKGDLRLRLQENLSSSDQRSSVHWTQNQVLCASKLHSRIHCELRSTKRVATPSQFTDSAPRRAKFGFRRLRWYLCFSLAHLSGPLKRTWSGDSLWRVICRTGGRKAAVAEKNAAKRKALACILAGWLRIHRSKDTISTVPVSSKKRSNAILQQPKSSAPTNTPDRLADVARWQAKDRRRGQRIRLAKENLFLI